MSGDDAKILVIGLPKTGKSTFLAALWDVVGSGEVAESLRLEKLSGDQQYLNDLRDLWADCHEVPRTRTVNENVVSMTLRETRTNRVSEVVFSDMSGESFQSQWTERAWTQEYDKVVRSAVGAMLFLHPSEVREPVLIRDAQSLISRIAAEKDESLVTLENALSENVSDEATPAKRRFVATQVQLVELLQFIHQKRAAMKSFHISVIISAWDIVLKRSRKKSPEAWLKERLPLLDQYLLANAEISPFRIYGVSAQGGDIATDADRLRKSHRPSDRIIVAKGSSQSHDISDSLRWAMGITDECVAIDGKVAYAD